MSRTGDIVSDLVHPDMDAPPKRAVGATREPDEKIELVEQRSGSEQGEVIRVQASRDAVRWENAQNGGTKISEELVAGIVAEPGIIHAKAIYIDADERIVKTALSRDEFSDVR